MDKKNSALTIKIISSIDKILEYIGSSSKEDFLKSSILIEACVFNLLQIGEIASRFDESFRDGHKNIPWHKVRGLRNRLVHDYEGVNLELVWDIIEGDLKALREQFNDISRA